MKSVIDSVVSNDLCVGCGICTYKNSNFLKMKWNEEGFLVPSLIHGSESDLNSNLELCPFNPHPEEAVRTENEISDIFLKEAHHHHSRIGRYNSIYVGSVPKFRQSSSSGGMATFIFATLMEEGHVDHIVSVRESKKNHYEFAVSSSLEELYESSKTKYYPVTLATVFNELDELPGTVAVSGVACFIKAIRLAQYYHPELREKVKFLVGIICGGVKSKFFTEYLASKSGIQNNNYCNPNYRIKDYTSTANDYSFGCMETTTRISHEIKMRQVGDMWGTGLFKANGCDFCDDVTTELADISLGDAWLEPYVSNGAGTSVIVTRTNLSQQIIDRARLSGEIDVNILPLSEFLKSQQGSFRHRQNALSFRMKVARKNGKILPPKRYEGLTLPTSVKLVQILRSRIRARSLQLWLEKPISEIFDQRIKGDLFCLKLATKLTQIMRKYIGAGYE